jgi:hypothetical protein
MRKRRLTREHEAVFGVLETDIQKRVKPLTR